MKRIMLMLIFILVVPVFSLGAVPTGDDDKTNIIINKIDQESATTRQYFSKELVEREKSFLDEFTQRADYYEGSIDDMIVSFMIKLGALWGGVIFFFVSLTHMVKNRTEAKKYEILKESLKKDIQYELRKEYLQLPEEEIKKYQEYLDKEEAKKIQQQEIKKEVPVSTTKKEPLFKRLFPKKKETKAFNIPPPPPLPPKETVEIKKSPIEKMRFS